MNLVKNSLALFGVLTLAMNAAADLHRLVALSKYVAFLVNNWNQLVHDVWRELCTLLGLPVIAFLAGPFSFLVAGLALGLSCSVTLKREGDAIVEEMRGIIEEEAARPEPVARHAVERIQLKLARSTPLSLYAPDKTRVLPVRDGDYLTVFRPVLWIAIITTIYAASDVTGDYGGGVVGATVHAMVFGTQWMFLYVLPFFACVGMAGYLAYSLPAANRADAQEDWIVWFRQTHPEFAAELNGFRAIEAMVDRLSDGIATQPLLDILHTEIPRLYLGRRVIEIMSSRAVAALVVVLGIYAASYVIIALEAVGLL